MFILPELLAKIRKGFVYLVNSRGYGHVQVEPQNPAISWPLTTSQKKFDPFVQPLDLQKQFSNLPREL